MGIVTTYVCDRCQKSNEDGEQMWEIGLALRHHGFTNYHTTHDIHHKGLWCRPCCVEVGILAPFIIDPEWKQPDPITLEDLVREIVKRERDNDA